jgi:hypothetical protein
MNRPRHLSDDELIGLLYGLGDGDGHLTHCSECGERWDEMRRALGMARAESSMAVEVSARRLALQRQRILERLEQPNSASLGWRWVPVATAASLLAAAMFLHQRPVVPEQSRSAPVAVNTDADAKLFTDVYSMEQDVEPKAAAPIRALFQETALEEERQ